MGSDNPGSPPSALGRAVPELGSCCHGCAAILPGDVVTHGPEVIEESGLHTGLADKGCVLVLQ
jgi:hypothetical protein